MIMKKHLKEFCHRGLVFGGLGPIVLGIVYAIISHIHDGFSLTGNEVLIAIVSTYILAFVQAGVSVFNQIECWPVAKSLLCHFSLLYVTYVVCYLVNSWIPFDIKVIYIFSLIFIVSYFIIWIGVYLSVKMAGRRMNEKLR